MMIRLDDILTPFDIMAPYGDRDLGQIWLSYWLVALRHQALTWTNIDFPLGVHMWAISQRVSHLLFCILNLKSTLLRSLPHLPRAIEFTRRLLHILRSEQKCWNINDIFKVTNDNRPSLFQTTVLKKRYTIPEAMISFDELTTNVPF